MDSSRFLPGPATSRTESVAELVVKIVSGAAGAGATALAGNPLAGVGTSIAASQAGTGLLGAFLDRGDDLALLTMEHAANRFEERKKAGDTPRPDPFEGTPAVEAVAATIKAAANTVEDRKTRLIGSLLASSQYEKDFPVGDLLHFLGLLEDLSWRQALALAYFVDESRQADRTLIAAGGSKGVRQIRPVLEAELAELAEVHGLIGVVVVDGGGRVAKPTAVYGGTPIVAANLDKVGPTGFGRTLYRLAEMNGEIGADDLDDFVQDEIL
jgi:hypothetical protein